MGSPARYPLDVALMSALVALGLVALGSWRGGPTALASVAASLFPALYIGLPVGALVAIRTLGGARALFLLMLTVIVSDTAQYYSGRAFGRRPLAPVVSPKKTIEGAIGGAVFGTALFALVGIGGCRRCPPHSASSSAHPGGAGDRRVSLESMLKRSAGVKDSSSLIPGHGGILDRIRRAALRVAGVLHCPHVHLAAELAGRLA